MALPGYAVALRDGRDHGERDREDSMTSAVPGISRAHGRGRGERGATLVEFSISASLLLLLLFGIISYGYVLSFKQGMTQAAAEGARAEAVGSSWSGPVGKAVDAFHKSCT